MFKKKPHLSVNQGAPKWLMPLIFVIVLVVVIAGLIYFTKPFGTSLTEDFKHGEDVAAVVATGEYQAVFLSNNQVYFGKVTSSLNAQYVVLEDVFYIQPSVGAEQTGTSMIKLGNETHGPEDKMSINRDHVLMVENLRGDSQIVQAIAEYKTSKE
jgi:hypothetical protein